MMIPADHIRKPPHPFRRRPAWATIFSKPRRRRENSQLDTFSGFEVYDVPDDIAEGSATNLPGDINEAPAEPCEDLIGGSPEETFDEHTTAEAGLTPTDSQTIQAEQPEKCEIDSASQPASDASLPPAADATRERNPSRPTITRPKPAESSQVYASLVLSHLPPEYLRWNRWIAEYSFADVRRDDDVYLSFTPAILTCIAEDFGDSSAVPATAESDFVAVIGEAYRRIISQDGRLRVLRAIDREGIPLCLAFLVASVLAAYRMQSNEEVSGGAYYFRLAELLGCDMVAGHPRGFDSAVFESLWIFLEKWLADGRGARLAMPNPETGVRRLIALPLTHVPLRRLDIEKLPAFFVWAGYAPGATVPQESLFANLERWVRSYGSFSSAGTAAVMDERRRAVLAQIAHELAAWDGSATEASGRRSTTVELILDIVRYRPDLFYVPRRPDGFPDHFDDGMHVFDVGDDGWYAPVQLSARDGPDLSNGFEWKSNDNLRFRRPPAAVIPLGPSPDYTGFLSRSNLLRGTPCAVLCDDSVVQAATEYLGASSGQACLSISHPSLPGGWRLFPNVKPDRHVEVPTGLEALGLASEVDVICSGGLRLGRRRAWLLGAPPRIIIAGLGEGDVAMVDGHVVQLDGDGVLQMNGDLATPGNHVIDVGGLRRTIEIVEPMIASVTIGAGFDPSAFYVTLPAGEWCLLGAVPGQLTERIDAERPGKICKAPFHPVWAISVGAGRGAKVISINASPRALQPALESRSTRYPHQWISIIYDAAVRRPTLASLLPHSDSLAISTAWKQYALFARQMKRNFRRRR